jgi:hypothetical protein
MLVAALVYVAQYGSNVPSWDDWDMVPTMTGEQPITWTWLWSQHNEHRIPVPRLVMLGLFQVFGNDFRMGMYFNVLSTAALALGMIFAAKRLRGWLSCADAYFAVLLLNLGQGVNFIWGWQVEFFLSTVFAGIALLIIVHSGDRLNMGTATAIGLCLILLVGSGAHGVVLVPPLALWLSIFAVFRWQSSAPHAKRDGLVLLGIASLGLLLTALYLIGYERVPYHPFTLNPMSILRTSVQFLTMAFGPAVRSVWPFSGLAVLGLLLFAVTLLALVIRNQILERYRALGLFFFLAAMGCLALALGLGRNGFEPRYITLSVPVMCCVYFVCALYCHGRIRQLVQMSLLAVTCITLWPNTEFGISYAQDLRARLGSFEQEMAAGVPSYVLINRYGPYLHIHQEITNDYMPMLRSAGIGSFAYLKDNPAFREIRVPLYPSALSEVEWQSGTAYATGRSPHLVFPLPQRQYVCGIRLKYVHATKEGTLPSVSVYWKNGEQEEFTADRFWKNSPTGDRANWERGTWLRLGESETTMEVWSCDWISHIRIHPDLRPCVFKILEIVLLVPAAHSIE